MNNFNKILSISLVLSFSSIHDGFCPPKRKPSDDPSQEKITAFFSPQKISVSPSALSRSSSNMTSPKESPLSSQGKQIDFLDLENGDSVNTPPQKASKVLSGQIVSTTPSSTSRPVTFFTLKPPTPEQASGRGPLKPQSSPKISRIVPTLEKWINGEWRISVERGNPWIRMAQHHVVITTSVMGFSACIDGQYLGEWYSSILDAKKAAYVKIWGNTQKK